MDLATFVTWAMTFYALRRREPIQVWANVDTGDIVVVDPPSVEPPDSGGGWRPASQYEIGLYQGGGGPPYPIPEFLATHPDAFVIGLPG